jgi:hypothetical protein
MESTTEEVKRKLDDETPIEQEQQTKRTKGGVVQTYRKIKGYHLCLNEEEFRKCCDEIVNMIPLESEDEDKHYKFLTDHIYNMICDVYKTLATEENENIIVTIKELWNCYAINGICIANFAGKMIQDEEQQSFTKETWENLFFEIRSVLDDLSGKPEEVIQIIKGPVSARVVSEDTFELFATPAEKAE